jgi:aspartate carbamoyltransferase catalytic subunit
MHNQFDSDGHLRHLLSLKDFTRDQVVALLDRAQDHVCRPGAIPVRGNALAGRTVAQLFFEPSTRTRASFELAARRLGADVLNLDLRTSSRAKGESLLDTVYTLQAMQCDIFVVRDSTAGVPDLIAAHVAPHVRVLNGGEADISHPTQGLLDMLTIRQHKPDFGQLVVTIIGDIRHSRVARSATQALAALGVGELRLVAPAPLRGTADDFPGAVMTDDIDSGVAGADVLMVLRIQKERITESDLPDADDYFRRFGLTAERVALAQPDAIVMHPGPMNREVEIASDVADGPQSVIEEQVSNGVAVRMAVMESVMEVET